MKSCAIVLLLAATWVEIASGKVSVPPLFSDSMVLQRSQPLRFWGTAEPGEAVTVTLGGESGKTTAGTDGRWIVELPARPASFEGAELRIAGTNQLLFQDVVIGDVWVCSGQSNMAFLLGSEKHASTELPNANHPGLRFFRVTPDVSFAPKDSVPGKSWVRCTPETAKAFSAVAYYFGKEILQRENVPIGLVGSYWGGTPAEAWTSSEALKGHPLLKHYLDERDLRVREMDVRMKRYRDKVLPKWESDHEVWENASRTAGVKSPEPRKPTAPDRNPSTPTVLFNAMIYPLLNYGLKGVIWYQGEANAKTKEKSCEYAHLFPTMIADWRAQWGRGEFPFLFVQLAGYGEGTFFPELREAQAKTLSLPNTGMAVALDVGERGDIHPTNKRTVGERLALVARNVAYGEDVLYEGPAVASLESDGESLRLHFLKTGGKLICEGAELRGFELAGEDGKFTAVPAVVEGEVVVLDGRGVSAPRYIHYGWAPYSEGNLYNAAALPAAPFVKSVQELRAGVR